MDSTTLAEFMVLDSDGEGGCRTHVEHKVCPQTGYDLVTITQHNEDDSIDCVVLSRADLLSIQSQVKGH